MLFQLTAFRGVHPLTNMNPLNGSLIVGNGDINALVYSNNNSVVMNLTKNDVWDARLETLNDPPIPTIDLIKQLGTRFARTSSGWSLHSIRAICLAA